MLPGGLLRGGELRRDYAFAPLTGEVELALAEAGRGGGSLPRRVTAVLSAALAELAGGPATPEEVRSLCVADRQYLMRQLGARLGPAELWLSAGCAECGAAFDLPVRPAELPVKPAGAGFPVAVVSTEAGGEARFRVPTGADQEAVAGLADPDEARRLLARRCRLEPSGLDLAEGDLEKVEEALERVSPELTLRVGVACPECGAANEVYIDPYRCLGAIGDDLFGEIHALASVYHWSEREILGMPRERRHLYLRMVERSRGVAG